MKREFVQGILLGFSETKITIQKKGSGEVVSYPRTELKLTVEQVQKLLNRPVMCLLEDGTVKEVAGGR